jgi:serine/threonine protein kinase
MPERQAMQIAACVGGVLDLAWQVAGLTHRGLTPDNVMIAHDGTIKLADLGMVPPDSGSGPPSPTPHAGVRYVAPEQARGRPVAGIAADVYALGAVLYFILTGVEPFAGRADEEVPALQVHGFMRNPRAINPEITSGCVRLLTHALMKDPARRHAVWRAFVAEVEAVRTGRIVLKKTVDGVSSIERRDPAVKPVGRLPNRRSTDRVLPGDAPALLRFPLWVLLFGFWGFLIHRQATDPILTTIWQPPLPVPRAAGARTPPPRTTRPPAARAPAPTRPAPVRDVNAVLLRALEHAINSNNAAALDVLYNNEDIVPRPAANLLRRIMEPSDLLGDAFRSRIGSETLIVLEGEQRRIVPVAVAGEQVRADLLLGAGGAAKRVAVSFSLRELTGEEKLRQIAQYDPTAGKLLACLAHIRKGESAAARALAPACGPLADTVGRYLDGAR